MATEAKTRLLITPPGCDTLSVDPAAVRKIVALDGSEADGNAPAIRPRVVIWTEVGETAGIDLIECDTFETAKELRAYLAKLVNRGRERG